MDLFISEGDEAHNAGAFYGAGDFSLMGTTKAAPFFGNYFGVRRSEFLEDLSIFPINFFYAGFAEKAGFFFCLWRSWAGHLF